MVSPLESIVPAFTCLVLYQYAEGQVEGSHAHRAVDGFFIHSTVAFVEPVVSNEFRAIIDEVELWSAFIAAIVA